MKTNHVVSITFWLSSVSGRYVVEITRQDFTPRMYNVKPTRVNLVGTRLETLVDYVSHQVKTGQATLLPLTTVCGWKMESNS